MTQLSDDAVGGRLQQQAQRRTQPKWNCWHLS